jgi:hypothetical protein
VTAEERNVDRPCPRCGATDLGDVIPPELNRDECFGPQGIRARRHIGIYSRELDRTIASRCWSCGHEWVAGRQQRTTEAAGNSRIQLDS